MQLCEPVLRSGNPIAPTALPAKQRAAFWHRLGTVRAARVPIPAARLSSRIAGRPTPLPLTEGFGEGCSLRHPNRPSRFARRDLDELGRLFARLEHRGALAHWIWGQALLGACEADPVPLPEAGKRVGLAARGKKYSKEWMSRVLIAARACPRRPATPAEWAAFMALLHGHAPTVADKDVPVALRIQRLLKQLLRVATKAVRLGCPRQELHQQVDAVPASVGDVPKTEPPGAPTALAALVPLLINTTPKYEDE